MPKFYRAVSEAEWKDFNKNQAFTTARNTFEGKQFFKTEEAIREYVSRSYYQKYAPPYTMLIIIDAEIECLKNCRYEEQILDGFSAITIQEQCLKTFNKCFKFERSEALWNNI